MLTEFGKKLRTLRIEHGKTLSDLGNLLDLSSAFISAIETGRKSVPAGFARKVADVLGLNTQEASELDRAASKSVAAINLPLEGRSDHAKELAVAFARRFETMSDADVKKLLGDLGDNSKKD